VDILILRKYSAKHNVDWKAVEIYLTLIHKDCQQENSGFLHVLDKKVLSAKVIPFGNDLKTFSFSLVMTILKTSPTIYPGYTGQQLAYSCKNL